MAESASRKISTRRLAMYDRYIGKLRLNDVDRLTKFCKLHLSFLLDMDKEQFEDLFTEKSDSKGLLRPLLKRRASKRGDTSVIHERTIEVEPNVEPAVTKLVTYLRSTDNLSQEGLFRKSGNITRQKELKDRLQRGHSVEIDMSAGKYSAHDCASVLKSLLGDLSEPVLLERIFNAYLHSLELNKDEQRLRVTTLLLQMLPSEHYSIAKAVFTLLYDVASNTELNRMDADSLGTVFAPHMLCPKKFSGSDLQSLSPKMQSIVAYIINNTPQLFQAPEMLALDVINYMKKANMSMNSSEDSLLSIDSIDSDAGGLGQSAKKHKLSCDNGDDEEAVDTVVTFTARCQRQDSTQDTEVELAKLYAHVQAMPESAKKRKIMKQFSDANGYHRQVEVRRKHSRSRSLGESIKRRFSRRSKQKSLNVSVESPSTNGSFVTGADPNEMVTITSIQTTSSDCGLPSFISTPLILSKRRYKHAVMNPIKKVSSSCVTAPAQFSSSNPVMDNSNIKATSNRDGLEISTLTASPYSARRASVKNLRADYMPDGAEASASSDPAEQPSFTLSSRERLAPIGGEATTESPPVSDKMAAPVPAIRKVLLPVAVLNTPEHHHKTHSYRAVKPQTRLVYYQQLRDAQEHKNTPPGPKRAMSVVDSGFNV